MAGFKSFAEPTAIDIEPGLTGIVGPNGCGKSNIVEGLRWVMGESSARQMRGNEMDDVIFAGTEQRPSRNLAEITLQLDNSQRRAPAEFNDIDDIEVKRKIERGKGSSYTVNAKPARARDIQLLFADTATGARTSGIVSQGRIGAIVGAKPVDRRILIEEAANIRGLHARRHEAELRLRGAETNLERLDDVIASLIEQREALKKQARQAARYRSVADRIRKAEAQLLLARWQATEADKASADEALHRTQLSVAERTEIAARSATTRSEIAATLPPLRAAEAEKAAEYQRLTLGREELDREEARLKEALAQIASRQDQIRRDIARETALRDDANAAIARLASEQAELGTQISKSAPQQAAATAALEDARISSQQLDATLAEASAALRAAATTRSGMTNRLSELTNRQTATTVALAQLSLDDLAAAAAASQDSNLAVEADFAAATAAVEAAEASLAQTSALRHRPCRTPRWRGAIVRSQAVDTLQYLLDDNGDSVIADCRPTVGPRRHGGSTGKLFCR